jgi:uncharacterized membrane protein YczE
MQAHLRIPQPLQNLLLTQNGIFITWCILKNFINACRRSTRVNDLIVFFVRAIFGGVFALIITRMFRPSAEPVYVVGLGVILVGLAYGFEYYRKRKTTPKGP